MLLEIAVGLQLAFLVRLFLRFASVGSYIDSLNKAIDINDWDLVVLISNKHLDVASNIICKRLPADLICTLFGRHLALEITAKDIDKFNKCARILKFKEYLHVTHDSLFTLLEGLEDLKLDEKYSSWLIMLAIRESRMNLFKFLINKGYRIIRWREMSITVNHTMTFALKQYFLLNDIDRTDLRSLFDGIDPAIVYPEQIYEKYKFNTRDIIFITDIRFNNLSDLLVRSLRDASSGTKSRLAYSIVNYFLKAKKYDLAYIYFTVECRDLLTDADWPFIQILIDRKRINENNVRLFPRFIRFYYLISVKNPFTLSEIIDILKHMPPGKFTDQFFTSIGKIHEELLVESLNKKELEVATKLSLKYSGTPSDDMIKLLCECSVDGHMKNMFCDNYEAVIIYCCKNKKYEIIEDLCKQLWNKKSISFNKLELDNKSLDIVLKWQITDCRIQSLLLKNIYKRDYEKCKIIGKYVLITLRGPFQDEARKCWRIGNYKMWFIIMWILLFH